MAPKDIKHSPNLVELLERRAEDTPELALYTYLKDGEVVQDQASLAQVAGRARQVAAALQARGQAGDRVMLFFMPGVEFVTAFFGCLYARRIAIPLPVPRQSRLRQSLEAVLEIARSARPAVVLTSAALKAQAEALFGELPELAGLTWIADEEIDHNPDHWQRPEVAPDDIAYLQYTSGSTALPKGVVLSHSNLLHNLHYFDAGCLQGRQDARLLTWLPSFHDLGLIYGLLTPVHSAIPCFIMSGSAFVQRPVRWLQAISDHRITHTMGPNFAYELCLRSIDDEQLAALDLSHWRHTLNGAEPVRMETMTAFARRFAPAGFRLEAFGPAWGLAEASCIVTSRHYGGPERAPRQLWLQAGPLGENRLVPCEADHPDALSLCANGFAIADTELSIVDPATRRPCEPDRVGEIWVRNGAVARGYWENPPASRETFGATLADQPDGPVWMRTGDLGFLEGGELFITGRLKDVIIIHGRNHYPQDIEWTVDHSHDLLRPGGSAAFALTEAGEERLGIVAEVGRHFRADRDQEAVLGAIRREVSGSHGVRVAAIALIRQGTIPKTTSGKIQRRRTRQSFLEGGLTIQAQWRISPATETAAPAAPVSLAYDDLCQWLRRRVAQLAGLEPARVGLDGTFGEFGLDSTLAVQLTGDLAAAFTLEGLPDSLVYDYPTIGQLARHLAGDRHPGDVGTGPAPDLAVVGLDCRFPGADGPQAFWNLLLEGRSAIGPLPADRRPLLSGADSLGQAGFLDGVALFDADFFGISPKEATQMDPQQRLLLTGVWRALENAGITRQELAGSRTGVFVGISGSDYARLAWERGEALDGQAATGTAASIAANRISYFLDLHGPSLAVDTACSSSLTALHLARQSLLDGECDTAIVGGVNLLLNPTLSQVLERGGMLSPSRACHSFDARADGYVRGEGMGVVVLRRLALARERDNPVLALVRGSAVQQDGRSFGLTAPNGPAQQMVLAQALAAAGIAPGEIQYLEAHGTGTALGDPIEVGALKAVLGQDRRQPCHLGSVKANIGHLEAAAGIAGFIKGVLCLQHGQVPPLAGLERLNPRIDLGEVLTVDRQPVTFGPDRPLNHLGVTSMGFGGTNVHVVLSRYEPAAEAVKPVQTGYLPLVLSAASDTALNRLAGDYADLLEQQPDQRGAICRRAALGRSALERRLVAGADEAPALVAQLRRLARGEADSQASRGRAGEAPVVALAFTGQGSQSPAMARELYRQVPAFREVVDRCDALLRTRHDLAVVDWLYGDQALSKAELARTCHAQPALFVIGYALGRLLTDCGLRPALVFGHSLGEYMAACFAGALSLSDALTLVVERARLMEQAPEGAMLAVAASRRQLEALGLEGLEIAAVNGPERLTVTGPVDNIQALAERCRQAGLACRPLAVNRAFHSAALVPVAAEFEAIAARVAYSAPELPVLGNLDGQPVTGYDAGYWARQLRQSVDFAGCLESARRAGVELVVEVGARPALNGFIAQQGLTALTTLTGQGNDLEALGRCLATLFCRGLNVDWRPYFAGQDVSRPRLPNYPFEPSAYWLPEVQSAPVAPPAPEPVAAEPAETASGHSPAAVTGWLTEQLARLLKTTSQRLDARRSFLDSGADSLVLVELVRQVGERYGLEVSLQQLFAELASPEALAEFIAAHAPAEPEEEATRPIPVSQPAAPAAVAPVPTPPAAAGDGLHGLLARQLDAFNQMIQAQLTALGTAPAAAPQAILAPPATPATPAAPAAVARAPAGSGLTPAQRRHLQRLVPAYQARTAGSKRYAEDYRQVFSDYRSSLGFRDALKELIYPLVVQSARGSRVTDIDGHEYVDLAMAFGSSILGYNPPLVTEAIRRQLADGIQVGPKSPLTGEVARLVAELTGMERVAFANSGTEAVMTALRLARAVTGRTRILRFNGAYHGHSDTTLVKAGGRDHAGLPIAPGVPAEVAGQALVVDYGRAESLEVVRRHAHQLAAVLVEPVQSRRPDLQPREFLEELRTITRQAGCALVFDEIITGFRLAPGGAQEYFGVRADLAVYGKVAGGGMPIGIIAGDGRFMDAIDGGPWAFGDDSRPGSVTTFFAGTFSGHPLTMAASRAVLGHLRQQGPALYRALEAKTRRLADDLNRFFDQQGYPIQVHRAGSLFRFVFNGNYSVEFQPLEANLFFYNMTLRGVYIWEGHTCFLSEAHDDADVERIIAAAQAAAAAMRADGLFPRPDGQDEPSGGQRTEGEGHDPETALNQLAVARAGAGLQALGLELTVGRRFGTESAARQLGVVEARLGLFRRLLAILAETGWLERDGEDWRVVQTPADPAPLARRAARTAPQAVVTLLERCGAALAAVLQGRCQAAEVLFGGDGQNLVEALYREAPGMAEANVALSGRLRELLARRAGEPVAVLEVGAGTGATTRQLLPLLADHDCRYTFTDLSGAFLPRARQAFSGYDWLDYQSLDIERNPADQGFGERRFDLIVAANVVHATRDLAATLDHLQALLAPGGELLLLEAVARQPWLDLIFGLTDGWWRFADHQLRPDHALLAPHQWQSLLAGRGLTAQLDRTGTLAVIQARPATPKLVALAPAQQEILVHLEWDEAIAPAYNESALFDLTGPLDRSALAAALGRVVARHQSLRARLTPDRRQLRIDPPRPLTIPVQDFSALAPQAAEAKAGEWVRRQGAVPFDLEAGPLLRAQLLRLAPERHQLLLTAHHLIIDGLSYGVLVNELLQACQGRELAPVLSLAEVNGRAETHTPAAARWWQERFATPVPYLELPTDRPFPARQSFEAGRTHLTLSGELAERLRTLGRTRGATPAMVLLAAWRLLLNRWCGQRESVVGMPVSVHGQEPGRSFVGFGVNLLALRESTPANLPFQDYLLRTREGFLGALAHKDYPFPELVRTVNPERDSSRPALITVLFNYEPITTLACGELAVTPRVPPVEHSKYELVLDAVAGTDALELVLTYNRSLFEATTARDLLERFEGVLSQLAADPALPLGQVDLLLSRERQALGMNPPEAFSGDCLHRLIARQAARSPEAVALRWHDTRLSYRELESRANRLARLLLAQGVGRGDRVAVGLPRTPELIVTLLAVLKTGAAYVPLDRDYPAERLTILLERSQAALVIVDRPEAVAGWQWQGQVLALAGLEDELAAKDDSDPQVPVSPRELAYLIFTSGSTGVPKGVAIEHRSAAALIDWAAKEFDPAALAGVLASTSVCFDLSVFEIFLPLALGRRVILVENVLHLPQLAEGNDITLINTVPSAMEELVKQGAVPDSVRVVNLAGEALSGGLVERIQARYPAITLYNLYGPSEDTTYTTCLRLPAGHRGAVTIGRPLPGTRVYLLDRQLNPVPPGAKGTLFVAGNGLCRGYWNNPRATAGVFLPDPFALGAGERMYDTGDLGRLNGAGEIEYLGRQDYQIKLRGHRIELGEIEAALDTAPAVERAVVLPVGSGAGQSLAACVVPAPGAEPATLEGQLRAHLEARLPRYMVPGRWLTLEALPLTPNGKADRKALAARLEQMPLAARQAPSQPPRNPLEEELAAIWQDHLQVEGLGIHDDFFALGGHSLLATRILHDINQRLGCRLRLTDMMSAPTLAGLQDRLLESLVGEDEDLDRLLADLDGPALAH